MDVRTDFVARLRLHRPLIQAPMAGEQRLLSLLPRFLMQVLGSLGWAYLSPTELQTAIRQIKMLTQQPPSPSINVPGFPLTE